MPGFPDKIIINSWRDSGMNSLIDCDVESLKYLAEELEEMDKTGQLSLKNTLDLRDRMLAACDKYNKAQMTYHEELQKLIEETRVRIDKALGL